MIRFVLRGKPAPAGQPYSESRKEIAAHHVAFGFLGLSVVAHCDFAVGKRYIGDDVRERVVLLPKGVVHWIRKRIVEIDGAGSPGRV